MYAQKQDGPIFVLIVEDRDGTPDAHGPFDSLKEAQDYAERYRAAIGLPVEATEANQEAWSELGWYFGIEVLIKDVD